MVSAITVNVVLLNYNRPQNIPSIIEALRAQSVPVNITLWHNGVTDDIPGADRVVHSSANLGCLARWHMAAQSGCDYVVSLDDDLVPEDPRLFERCIAASEAAGDSRIIGRSGKLLGAGPRYYRNGTGVSASRDGDREVDVVKGRFMFVPVRLLSRVPLYFEDYEGRGDDIWISLWTADRRAAHILPRFIRGAFREIPDAPESNVGLADDPSHQLKRDMIISNLLEQGALPWFNDEDHSRIGRKIRRRVYGTYLRLGRRVRGYVDHRRGSY